VTRVDGLVAELKIYLSDSLNEKFRRVAMSVYGYGRGSLSKAAEEAFAKWCSEHELSQIREKTVGDSENSGRQPSWETESHVNPDERENANPETSRIGGDKSSKPIGTSN